MRILERHIMAFLLTLVDTFVVRAISIIESETFKAKESGTMVAIIENASNWAGSFLDRRSDSIAWLIVFQTA